MNLEEVAAYQDDAFPKVFDYLEKIAPVDQWMFGEQFTLADIALASPVRLLDLAGAPLDAARWPTFERYYRRIYERASAQSIIAEETSATEVWRTTGGGPT